MPFVSSTIDMLMQLASLLEVDITGLAKERPFARMDANMIQDIAFSVEGLAAVRGCALVFMMISLGLDVVDSARSIVLVGLECLALVALEIYLLFVKFRSSLGFSIAISILDCV